MCGIAGFLGGRYSTLEEASTTARRMATAIASRGPDDDGVWIDAKVGVALAHRRLAIIDLSHAGHQPMHSTSGRSVIVFNGEIYNHLNVRHQLENRYPNNLSWRGHSDTETLLVAIECWGLEKALGAVTGMFAFVFWDRKERTLYLARDRIGEKPLYYGWQNGVFLFGSQLKALSMHPAFEGDIDRDALTLFLRHTYIPSPWSIYKGVRKLPAGTYLKITMDSMQGCNGSELPEPLRYWSLPDIVGAGQARSFEGTSEEAVDTLHKLLLHAVRHQMVADVPLGAFLSGGIDSATVVALMQAQSGRPVQTFTIGFDELGYNEAEYAKAVARHLGTDHTELYASARVALDVIPRLPEIYDEPFADSSQIPTFLVAEMSRRYVTVALSGDGGDELFGGYGHYLWMPQLWRWLSNMPTPLCRVGAHIIEAIFLHGSDWLLDRIVRRPTMRNEYLRAKSKARKLALLIKCRAQEDLYCRYISGWQDPAEIVRGASKPHTVPTEDVLWHRPDALEFANRLMMIDTLIYLPDDILVKVDRAAMGVSLETRAPFLNHHIAEFIWRLPQSFKIRDGQGKWILRQVLHKYVPKELIERPKMGFNTPIGSWLRGPLKDWAEALLDQTRLKTEGFFDPQPIRQKWNAHLNEHERWDQHLWSILMFQAWLDHSTK